MRMGAGAGVAVHFGLQKCPLLNVETVPEFLHLRMVTF